MSLELRQVKNAPAVKQTCSLLEIKRRIECKSDISHLSFPYFNRPSYELLFTAALAAASNASTFHAIVTSAETVTVLKFAFESIKSESVEGSLACVHALSKRLEYEPFEVLETMLKGQCSINNRFVDTIVSKLIMAYGPSTCRIVTVYKKRKALSRWSTILAAVFMMKAWRAFVQHALRPDSAFVQSYLKNRFTRGQANILLLCAQKNR